MVTRRHGEVTTGAGCHPVRWSTSPGRLSELEQSYVPAGSSHAGRVQLRRGGTQELQHNFPRRGRIATRSNLGASRNWR
jgi:hypothetical protein